MHHAPRIASVAHALGEYRYSQQELLMALKAIWAERHHNASRLDRLHRAVEVGARHLALPMERYHELADFTEANDAFIEVGAALGQRALERALAGCGLEPVALDALLTTTVTGLAVPTLDALLVNRMQLRRDVRRTPLFGLGCVGGAAGLARMADYLRAYPDQVAALLSVELCSLTLQRQDLSIANLIASGLFADGAAAVIGIGAERASALGLGDGAPRMLDQRSVFYRDTESIMGWRIGASGFEVVLSAALPGLIVDSLRPDVAGFLDDHHLRLDDVGTWICHPGGPKVLEATAEALGLDQQALSRSWTMLREVGNLSSASVLMVLERTLEEAPPTGAEDARAMIMAMGPGFCAELVLVSW